MIAAESAWMRLKTDFMSRTATLNGFRAQGQVSQHSATIRQSGSHGLSIPFTMSVEAVFASQTPRGPFAVDPISGTFADFADARGYGDLKTGNWMLDVTPAGAPETIVASYEVDLSGLGGGAGVVFASGFLSPADNQNGEAFGLFAALPDGTVVMTDELVGLAQHDDELVDHRAALDRSTIRRDQLDARRRKGDFAEVERLSKH